FFRTYDTIKIDAYVDCDSDGDEITFVYNNGSGWFPFYNANCNTNGKTHIITTKTLDNVEGNHTIRVTLAYNGQTNMVCSYNYDTLYSDTDDLTFYVYYLNRDLEKPKVKILNPTNLETFYYENGLIINISVNASDNIEIKNVSALIKWGSKNLTLNLINTSGLFKANFTNTSDFAMYNLSILSYDNSSNYNNTESILFYINRSKEIKILYPEENKLYPFQDFSIEYIIDNNETAISYSWAELNSGLANFDGYNKKISVEEISNESINLFEINNASQSFILEKDTYLAQLELMIKKSGNPANAYLEILSDDNGPKDIITYGLLDSNLVASNFNWIVIDLNEKIKLNKSQKYWLFINTSQSNQDINNFYDWMITNDIYLNGTYINNNTKDLLFILYDYYRFNLTASAISSQIDLVVYSETNQGLLSSNMLIFYLDEEAPLIYNYSYIPMNELDIDPGTTINFTLNITDNLEIENAFLVYRLNDFNWIEKPMINSSGLYKTNLTLNETNLTFFFRAYDTSNNLVETPDKTIEVKYENSWYVVPSSYNTTSGLLGINKTLGLMSIISNSDYDFSVNVSYLSNRTILFNGSESLLLNVESNKNKTFEINISSSNQIEENLVIINLTSFNNTSPKNYEINFTYISLLQGPYLFLEITEYYPVVYQGDYLSSIKAKLINLGNETAYNITIKWILPDGLTSRRNLTQFFSELQPGGIAYIVSQISADVSSTALGQKELKVIANASGNYSDSEIKNIEIKKHEETNSGSSGSSKSSSQESFKPVALYKEDDLFVDIKKSKIKRSELNIINFTLINNKSNKDYYVDFTIDGLFKTYYNFSEKKVYLKKDEIKIINLTIFLPEYFELGLKNYNLIINLYEPKNNNSENKFESENKFLKELKKDFDIVVIEEKKITCLNESLNKINSLEVNNNELKQKYVEAENYFKNEKYDLVLSFCNYVNDYLIKYNKTKNKIDELKNDIKKLKQQGYLTEQIENYYNLSTETFLKGNIEKANEILEKSSLIMANLEQPAEIKLKNFIILNIRNIFLIILILPIIIAITARLVYLSKAETKIKMLNEEKEKLINQIKKMQQYYYENKYISPDLYNVFIHQSRIRLGQIEVSLIKQKNRLKNNLNDFNEIENLIKELQQDFYVKKIISEKTYEELSKYYYIEYQKTKNSFKKNLKCNENLNINDKINEEKMDTGNKKVNKETNEKNIEIKTNAEIKTDNEKNDNKIKDNKNDKIKDNRSEINKIDDKTDTKIDNKKNTNEKNKDFFFNCKRENSFVLKDGSKLYSIKELYEKLAFNLIDEETFKHHVNENKNDFADWIKNVFNKEELSNQVRAIKTKKELLNLLEKIFNNIRN
ncbi:MAG: hypothetical protein QXR96_01450, partial [Candidatus Woesearchaeota archaeon]